MRGHRCPRQFDSLRPSNSDMTSSILSVFMVDLPCVGAWARCGRARSRTSLVTMRPGSIPRLSAGLIHGKKRGRGGVMALGERQRPVAGGVPLNREGSRRSHGCPLTDGRAVVARAARRPRLPGRRPRGHAGLGRRRQLCQSHRPDARDSGALTPRPSRGHCPPHLPPWPRDSASWAANPCTASRRSSG